MMTLAYARQRAAEILSRPCTAVLATSGPAGLQAGEIPVEADGLEVYLLLPRTSDHLFNLETNPEVTLVTAGWELKGRAKLAPGDAPAGLALLRRPEAEWCTLVRIIPRQVHVRRPGGWGPLETIDLGPAV